MNEIIKRYNMGMSIINNNQGVKTMLNKIYNKISNMLKKVGYHFVGYKVDIEQNIFDIKSLREYKVGIYDFKALQKDVSNKNGDVMKNTYNIKALRDTQSHIIDDIKAIQLTIKSSKPKASWGAKFKFGDEILEEIAKILVPYKDDDYLGNYGNKILIDIIDDINDKFNGFTNTYNDVCDDVDDINLTK